MRVTVETRGYTIEPAVEYREGDSFDVVAAELQRVLDFKLSDGDQMAVAYAVMLGIQQRWPDRAYFVEVWQEGRRGFAQVFQPFGLPRDRLVDVLEKLCAWLDRDQSNERGQPGPEWHALERAVDAAREVPR